MKNLIVSLFVLTVMVLSQSHAATLFGIDLRTATKATLRDAAKKTGARLKREASELAFYDEYSSANILEGSDKLYFGFSKGDEKFAFAEYEFKGFNNTIMLQKLISKYGQPKKIKQIFISDTIYRWDIDGVEISYYKDWNRYKTRLTYIVPEQLVALKEAVKKVDAGLAISNPQEQANVF